MQPFFAALAFLSTVPVPARWCGGERELGRSLYYFALVGLLFGGVLLGLDAVLGRLFPAPLEGALLAAALAALSGGLHLDGLADTADGFFSARSRERMLEIMRDSRSGPMGVIAIALMLLLKAAALGSLPAPWRPWTLLLMPLAGRCALVLTLAVLPYARPEGGLATVFHRNRSLPAAVLSAGLLLAAGWLALGLAGAAAALLAMAATLAFARYTYQKIGGLTGDTLGAACELTELVPALVIAAWAHAGAMGVAG